MFHNMFSSLLLSRDVLPSFPFNKFSIILEYGGPSGSSRLSSICPNLDGLPRLHFFHVIMENHNLPASLCEGFVSQHPKSTMVILVLFDCLTCSLSIEITK